MNNLAYWTDEKIFLRVYPCELTIADQTFQKGAPEILRLKHNCEKLFHQSQEQIKRVRKEWNEQLKKECEILKKGHSCPSNLMPRRSGQ